MSKIWQECLNELKKTITLQELTVFALKISASQTKNRLKLSSVDKLAFKWLEQNIDPTIRPLISQIDNQVTVIITNSKANGKTNIKSIIEKISTPLTKEYTFENLIIGNANMLVYHAAKSIANKVSETEYSPFIIYGDSGLGKTHILQAIGALAKKKYPDINIIYTPLIGFVAHITNSIRHKKIDQIKKCYQSADLLLIDDINQITDKIKSQEELFHILNFLFAKNKQVVLTCDTTPHEIKKIENRLSTRLKQGLSLSVKKPELELRVAILIDKAKKLKIELNNEVALFIASKIDANVRELEGAINNLTFYVRFKNNKNNKITVEDAKEALKDFISKIKKIIEIEEIQKIVCRYYGINITNLTSKKKHKEIVHYRQMAMYVSKQYTDLSLQKIGNAFKRDHTTVIHSEKTIKNKIKNNENINKEYKNLCLKIDDH